MRKNLPAPVERRPPPMTTPNIPICPHCGLPLVLRQRYVGGHGYGWYYECDTCVYGWTAQELEQMKEGAA